MENKKSLKLLLTSELTKELDGFIEKMNAVFDAAPMIGDITVEFGAYETSSPDMPIKPHFEVRFNNRYQYLNKEIEKVVLSAYLESNIIKIADPYNDGNEKYIETRPEFKILNNVSLNKYELLNIKERIIPTKIDEEKNDFNSNLERLKHI